MAGEEAHLRQLVREEAVARALQTPGLMSFQPAIRETPTGPELLIASTWNGFDELTALGRDLDRPVALPTSEPLLTESRAEHYELVIGEARTLPLREAKMRLTRIPIKPGAESAYYAAVRDWSERLLDDAGMVAFALGRRVVGRQDEIVAVQVWQDEAALREAAGGADVDQPMGGPELSRFWAADPAIEHFDALTATEPSPNAPAIFVMDNDRRYVHVTPAAARLSGRPLARLLTMRVDDLLPATAREALPEVYGRFIADGSMRGAFTFQRPDGIEVLGRYAARANTPWPGSHSSVIVAASHDGTGSAPPDDSDLDLDAALVDAGLVARYAPATG
jgi:PAS domain-containing protein